MREEIRTSGTHQVQAEQLGRRREGEKKKRTEATFALPGGEEEIKRSLII